MLRGLHVKQCKVQLLHANCSCTYTFRSESGMYTFHGSVVILSIFREGQTTRDFSTQLKSAVTVLIDTEKSTGNMLMLTNQLELRKLLEHSADLSASMLSIIVPKDKINYKQLLPCTKFPNRTCRPCTISAYKYTL